jgi:hypothetical protein
MKEFNFKYDTDSYEIFPKELYSNPLIVYHGTVEYYSEKIEKDGLIANFTPYNINTVKTLLKILPDINFSKYENKDRNCSIAKTIVDYLDIHKKNTRKLSFYCLSATCIKFTQNEYKGGQAFREIRMTKVIIDEVIKNDSNLSKCVINEVKELFDEVEKIDKSNGIVYAIKLPANLQGIELDNYIIRSSLSIPADSIIAKVVIPENYNTQFMNHEILLKRNESKLYNNGLGRELYNNINYDKD